MINFILFVTVVVFWLGAVYLYFVLSNMLEDVREINKDIIECKAMMKQKIEQDNIKAEIPNDEFLGIVGYVENLEYIGYTETIKIGTRIILSTFLMLVGIRIYDGK